MRLGFAGQNYNNMLAAPRACLKKRPCGAPSVPTLSVNSPFFVHLPRCRKSFFLYNKSFFPLKITFLVVGRTVDKHLSALIDVYAQRLGHYVPFDMLVVPELKNTKSLTEAQQKEREGEMLLRQLRPDDFVVLRDEGGRTCRSVDFAAYLEHKQHTVPRRLVFVVGGPYGFSSAVYAAAREKLSLSSMTFSHQMVRLLFVEQLYRAFTILRGEPYHHE